MPNTEYVRVASAPLETVWDFIKDMNNWAPYLTGYQKHEVLSETDSVWMLKGNLGAMTRTVQLLAHLTEWTEQQKVAFTLTGINESVTGSGMVLVARRMPDMTYGNLGARGIQSAPGGIRAAMSRLKVHDRVQHGAVEANPAGEYVIQLTFQLDLRAGGPSGPFVNAMLKPLLKPAAQAAADKIAAAVEQLHTRGIKEIQSPG